MTVVTSGCPAARSTVCTAGSAITATATAPCSGEGSQATRSGRSRPAAVQAAVMPRVTRSRSPGPVANAAVRQSTDPKRGHHPVAKGLWAVLRYGRTRHLRDGHVVSAGIKIRSEKGCDRKAGHLANEAR